MADDSFGADAAQRFLAVEVANDDRDEEISDWHDIEVNIHNFPILHDLFNWKVERRDGLP